MAQSKDSKSSKRRKRVLAAAESSKYSLTEDIYSEVISWLRISQGREAASLDVITDNEDQELRFFNTQYLKHYCCSGLAILKEMKETFIPKIGLLENLGDE